MAQVMPLSTPAVNIKLTAEEDPKITPKNNTAAFTIILAKQIQLTINTIFCED